MMQIEAGKPKELLQDPNSKFSGLVRVSGTDTEEKEILDVALC
jgi:hypothetical protein